MVKQNKQKNQNPLYYGMEGVYYKRGNLHKNTTKIGNGRYIAKLFTFFFTVLVFVGNHFHIAWLVKVENERQSVGNFYDCFHP